MTEVKVRNQKYVRFGISKDDNFEVENVSFSGDEVVPFNAARHYWQDMCSNKSPNEKRYDNSFSLMCM